MSKFLSRKFILAVLSAIGGAAIGLSCLEGTAGAVFSAVASIVPALVYIITEGAVDIANCGSGAEMPFIGALQKEKTEAAEPKNGVE